MNKKTILTLAYSFFIIFILFFSCTEYTPILLEPDKLVENEIAYFPLSQGYKADYDFSYSYRWHIGSDLEYIDHNLKGVFSLEVKDMITDTHAILFTIESTFRIQEEYYYELFGYNVGGTPIDSFYIRENFSINNEYYIVYIKEHIDVKNNYDLDIKERDFWYIDDPENFNHLEERKGLTPMMEAPDGTRGYLFLKLFSYPSVLEFNHAFGYDGISTNGEVRYKLDHYNDLEKYKNFIFAYFTKGKGITSVAGNRHYSIMGTGPPHWRSDISFTLIE